MLININDIKINSGRREATPEDVQRLSASIAEVGMMNPITVDADHTLVAGLHRLEAAKLLGWTEVECTVCELDGLHAELAEIDENVIRAGLSDLELSELLARRKKIYENFFIADSFMASAIAKPTGNSVAIVSPLGIVFANLGPVFGTC